MSVTRARARAKSLRQLIGEILSRRILLSTNTTILSLDESYYSILYVMFYFLIDIGWDQFLEKTS
uniref:Uncharacterized protein n=1 Tax=Picea glauca TaxID=3330 RepID=A0A117NGI8_PICGL|nr:hypothetical protein ABT39_MTgene6303 [Picea glauca]